MRSHLDSRVMISRLLVNKRDLMEVLDRFIHMGLKF